MSRLVLDFLRESAPQRAAPHNPDVEAQRPGCCVRDDRHGLWLAAPPKLGVGLLWSANPRDAHVFDATTAAFQASMMGCIVTTVPRWTGHFMTWGPP